MPKLIVVGNQKKEAPGIPPRIVAQYRRFVDRLPEKEVAFLKFTPKEDMKVGRQALLEAAAKSKKYLKIRKARGQSRTLQLQRCTKSEWDKANAAVTTTAKKSTKRSSGRKPGPKSKSQAVVSAN